MENRLSVEGGTPDQLGLLTELSVNYLSFMLTIYRGFFCVQLYLKSWRRYYWMPNASFSKRLYKAPILKFVKETLSSSWSLDENCLVPSCHWATRESYIVVVPYSTENCPKFHRGKLAVLKCQLLTFVRHTWGSSLWTCLSNSSFFSRLYYA